MCSNAICVLLFLDKRRHMLIERIPPDTAVNSYANLCVKTKEEKLSSGSSTELLSDEGMGSKSITSCWETLSTDFPRTNTSIPLV